MKGAYEVIIKSDLANFKFTLKRNITVVQGETATGKSLLYNIVKEFGINQNSATIISKVPVKVLYNEIWEVMLPSIKNSIVIIDEPNFVEKTKFIELIKETGNYFIIISRNIINRVPYSYREVYEIRKSGKFINFYPIFNIRSPKRLKSEICSNYDKVIIEDSGSGFQCIKYALDNCNCESSFGKSNIIKLINDKNKRYLIIADGASFGNELQKIYDLKYDYSIDFIIPESFEYCILKADILKNKEIRYIVENPAEYIDSQDWINWEQFFTSLLVTKTKDLEKHKRYNKNKLSDWYMGSKNLNKIITEYNIILDDCNYLSWD